MKKLPYKNESTTDHPKSWCLRCVRCTETPKGVFPYTSVAAYPYTKGTFGAVRKYEN